jgi:lactoylglutathione lyase
VIAAVLSLFEAHLAVADLDTSTAFYRDIIGLKLAHVTAARQAAFFWVGSPGQAMLGLWDAGASPQRTTTHVAFGATLEDVIAAPLRLRSLGITLLNFEGKPTDEPVVLAWMPAASIYFRDPDGHLLEYIAMLSDSPRPDAGVLPWREWQLARGDRRG